VAVPQKTHRGFLGTYPGVWTLQAPVYTARPRTRG